MKFSIKDFFSKCDEIRSFLRIWSHLLKKSFMENFILCAVVIATIQKIFLGLNLGVGMTPLYVFQLFKKCMWTSLFKPRKRKWIQKISIKIF